MKEFRILVPTDFSESSRFALEIAGAFARNSATEGMRPKIFLLHVQAPSVMASADADELGVLQPDQLWRHLQAAHLELEFDASIPMHELFRTGEAPTEILRAVDELRINLVVMGSHGRTGFAQLLLGSVAQRVIRSATCPVIVARLPKP